MCVRSPVKSSRNYSLLYKQMSMHVGGKSENDEEIEINVKRFDEKKQTHHSHCNDFVFFIYVSQVFFYSFMYSYFLFCILKTSRDIFCSINSQIM